MGARPYWPSQAFHLASFASAHFLAASSWLILSLMYAETVFWSSFVQLKFLTRSYSLPPPSANFLLTILSRMYRG